MRRGGGGGDGGGSGVGGGGSGVTRGDDCRAVVEASPCSGSRVVTVKLVAFA